MASHRFTEGKKQMKWVSLKLAPTLFFLVLATGCDWREILRPQSLVKKAPDEHSEKSADPSNEMMTAGEKFAFHRWLVSEMQMQIFAKSGPQAPDVNGWANVLSQRGSIEGVYHGLVLSADYSALEKGKAPTKAVRFFAQEMAALDHPNSAEGAPELREAAEKYARAHFDTPLFTLKRLMGERILEEAKARKDDKSKLASWYSSFASNWVKEGVDFGAAKRNDPSAPFHFKWAQENNLGMVQWEMLNRMHRIFNSHGGVAVANPAGK